MQVTALARRSCFGGDVGDEFVFEPEREGGSRCLRRMFVTEMALNQHCLAIFGLVTSSFLNSRATKCCLKTLDICKR